MKKISLSIIILFLLGLLIGSIAGRTSGSHLNPLSRAVLYIIQPFQNAANFLVSLPYKMVSYVRLNSSLQVENRLLKKAVEEYKYEIAQLEEPALEAQRLRELLSLKEKLPYATIAAEVVARVPGSHTFLINKGSKQGVNVGKAVISLQGLVGQVIESEANLAIAMAITHPKSGVGAMVQSSRDMGIVQGRGNEVLILSFLPPDAKLEKGALVVSSGMGGIYPKGIPIGYIKRIHSEKATTSLWAEVEPSVNFNRLEEVLIVK